jgi:hypothetical protein
VQLHLHEKRLAFGSARPVVAVVDFWVPIEIVIRLPKLIDVDRIAAFVEPRDAAPNAGPVARFLENFRHGSHALGQLNSVLAAAASMMMNADRILIHPSDHRRSKRRADWRSRVSSSEAQTLGGELIDMRSFDRSLAVAGKIRRHVVDHDPENIGSISGLEAACQNQKYENTLHDSAVDAGESG